MSRNLMIVGTGSGVGKSIVAIAVCRLLSSRRVRPFKAVCVFDGEGAAAQRRVRGMAAITEACGVAPSLAMNPVQVVMRSSDRGQLVVEGRSRGTISVLGPDSVSFAGLTNGDRQAVEGAVRRGASQLQGESEVVVAEGAGGVCDFPPAHDVANAAVAAVLQPAVIVVVRMDSSGGPAAGLGTLAALPRELASRLVGVVLTQFTSPALNADHVRQLIESSVRVPVRFSPVINFDPASPTTIDEPAWNAAMTDFIAVT